MMPVNRVNADLRGWCGNNLFGLFRLYFVRQNAYHMV